MRGRLRDDRYLYTVWWNGQIDGRWRSKLRNVKCYILESRKSNNMNLRVKFQKRQTQRDLGTYVRHSDTYSGISCTTICWLHFIAELPQLHTRGQKSRLLPLQDVSALEREQKSFTWTLTVLESISYKGRLGKLELFSLENQRLSGDFNGREAWIE